MSDNKYFRCMKVILSPEIFSLLLLLLLLFKLFTSSSHFFFPDSLSFSSSLFFSQAASQPGGTSLCLPGCGAAQVFPLISVVIKNYPRQHSSFHSQISAAASRHSTVGFFFKASEPPLQHKIKLKRGQFLMFHSVFGILARVDSTFH